MSNDEPHRFPRPASPGPNPDPVPVPLTLRNMRDEAYARLPAVETRLAALLPLPQMEIVRRVLVTRDFRDPAYVPDECLAYFVREWHRASVAEGLGELVAEVQRRVEGRVRSPFRSLAELAREEATNRVTERLWMQLFTLTSARGEYLQVRFGLALKRMILDVRTQMYDTSVHEGADLRDTRNDGDSGDGYDPLNRVTDDTLPLDERYALRDELRDALNAITDERHREAFVLRYVEQWPVEGDPPPTISGHFGKTSRTIRNWLTTAHAQFAHRQEEHDAHDPR